MKTKHIYLPALFLGLAFLINSCSSTQQFAGTYPKNNITGNGAGYGSVENKNKPVANTTASATVATVPISADVKCNDAEVATTTRVVKQHKAPSKFEKRMTTFAMNFMANHPMDAASLSANAGSKGLFGIREKLSSKIYAGILKKYDAGSKISANSSLEDVSRPLAITALAAGCAGALYYAGFFFATAAIVIGALALVGINRGGDGRKAFAITGIVLGAFFLIFWAVFAAVLITVF